MKKFYKNWLSFVKFGAHIEHDKTDILLYLNMHTYRITEPERTVILSDFESGIPNDPMWMRMKQDS